MKTIKLSTMGYAAGIAVLAMGCAERRTVYVPAYQPAPVYQGQPTYAYPPQTAYQSQPLVTQGQAGVPQPTTPAPDPGGMVAAQPQPQQMVVTEEPPAPQVEVQPVAPGPDYAWTPGYWSWNGRWVWVGGVWVVRPHPHAVWIGPRWVHRGHGYVWVRGRWR